MTVPLPDPGTVRTLLVATGGVLVGPDFGRVAAALRARGIAADAATLAGAEARAKKEIDRLAGRAPSGQERNREYFEVVLRHAGIGRSGATEAVLAELKASHDRHNLWNSVVAGVPAALARPGAGARRNEFLLDSRRSEMSAAKDPFARFLKHYDKGAVLFNEGDEGEEMYIIRSGRVAIKKKVPHGEVTVAMLEKGDFFGEMAMLERIARTAAAEMVEPGDLVVIDSETLSDMIKANPEIAVRMLRKYSLRLRETTKQIEELAAKAEASAVGAVAGSAGVASAVSTMQPPETGEKVAPQQAEAIAYFISKASGNVFPVFKADSLIGRYDSVTGMTPDVDLTQEDAARNISRRHARIVTKEGKHFVAEEIGTMNGTFLNGQKLPTGVLTPIADGDDLTLCRLALTFRAPSPRS